MTAYFICAMDILEPAGMAAYRELARPTVQAAGALFVVRRARIDALEGKWPLPWLTMHAFPDAETLERWYTSIAYRHALPLRQAATRSIAFRVDGTPDALFSLHDPSPRMKTYYFLDVAVHDADMYKEYVRLAPPTVAAAGGRFIVRGGTVTALEGELALHRLIVIEFPDRAAFDGWYQSSAYREMLALRERCCTSRAFAVAGIAPD